MMKKVKKAAMRADEIEQEAYRVAHSLAAKFAAMNAEHYREYPHLLHPSFRPNYTQCINELAAKLTKLLSHGLVILPPRSFSIEEKEK